MRLRRKQTLMDRASEFAETVIPQLESALEQAIEVGKESARDAQVKAAPLIAQGRQIAADSARDAQAKAAPLIAQGRQIAAEKASTGAAIAAEKAAIGRDLAVAKVATLRAPEPEPEPQGGRLKKLLLLTGLLALGGLVFSKLRGGQDQGWQSSYTPSPAPSTGVTVTTGTHAATGTGTETTDDVGGGTPGEAVADSVEEPRVPTTPDDPATIIDVDGAPREHRA